MGLATGMLGVRLAAGTGRRKGRRGRAGASSGHRRAGCAPVGVRGWAGVSECGDGCGCPCGCEKWGACEYGAQALSHKVSHEKSSNCA